MNIDEFGKAGGSCLYVRVSSDPANISRASKPVIRVDIEDIFNCQSYAKDVPGCRMDETLGLACGAGRLKGFEKWIDEDEWVDISHIKDKQRVLRRHDLRCAVVGDPDRLLVPPLVTALCPRNVVSGALENKDVLNVRAALDCRVDNGLGCDGLTTATPFVCGKDDAAFAVVDAVTKSLRGKASEYDRVNGTNACTGEEGSDSLPCHGKIDRDGVALLDTK